MHIDFCGANTPNREKCQKVLELMKDAEYDQRTARFVCVIAYIDENGKKHIFKGICEGKISNELRGETDFCYDFIFEYNGRTFAEMTMDEKNKVSHRGNAVNKLIEYLKISQ